MAVFQGVIRSNALAMDTSLQVILPYDRMAENQQTPCKALYLLHGLGDNAAAWCRYTAVERYAREKGLAVIMPEVQRSFYCDMALGLSYFTYVARELPALCAAFFHISQKREDTFVAGLSMGGYGALKVALTHPERYAACGSFSGVVDIAAAMDDHQSNENLAKEFQGILGPEQTIAEKDNLLCLARKVADLPPQKRPALFLTCGRQDFLYQNNVGFKAVLDSYYFDATFKEWDGDHTWDFWDESLRQAMDLFFPSSAQ